MKLFPNFTRHHLITHTYYIHYEDYVKRFLKKIVRVVSEIYKKALKVQILNEVALRQVATKRVRGNEHAPKFPSMKM